MNPLSCDDCRLLLSDLLTGEADSDAAAAADAHLATCTACRSIAEELVWQDLAISELAGRDRTQEILGRFRGSLEARKGRVKRPVQGRLPLWIAAAAAAVLVGGALILNLGPSGSGTTEPSEPETVGHAVDAPPDDLPVPYRAKPRPVETPPAVAVRKVEAPPVETPPPAPKPVPPLVRDDKPVPPKRPEAAPPRQASAPKVRPVTRPVIARLVRLRGKVIVAGQEAREGQDLLEGLSLAMEEGRGRSRVEFPDGTQLEFRSNTNITKLSAANGKRVFIDRGTVLARVAPQPKESPMVFVTPQGEATVLGTTLRVIVAPEAGKGTRVEVREGRVRLERTFDGRTVILSAGQYSIAAPGKPMLRRKLLPPLQELATAMKPASWAELETDGFEASEILVKPWMNILVETEEAMWDPVRRQLHVLGYTTQDEAGHFVYDEHTNAWERRKTPKAQSWFGPGYDHIAFDPAAQALFFRQHNHDLVHQLDVRTGTWSVLPRMPANPAEIGALEYFPEMGGLVFAGGGTVYLYRFRSKRWEVLAQGLEVGPSDAVTEYDPVHKVMLIGGGKGNRALFRLDPSGMIVKLREAPVALGLKDALIVTEPASGKLLVMTRPGGKKFYEYEVLSDRWTEMKLPPFAVMLDTRRAYTTAAPISRWGVVMYLVADENESHVYLYRHGRSRR